MKATFWKSASWELGLLLVLGASCLLAWFYLHGTTIIARVTSPILSCHLVFCFPLIVVLLMVAERGLGWNLFDFFLMNHKDGYSSPCKSTRGHGTLVFNFTYSKAMGLL